MTAKWMIKVSGGSNSPKVYGPYGQKRAEYLAQKLEEHFRKKAVDHFYSVLAVPMWDLGINELRRKFQ